MKTLEERFWAKVDKSDESGCWNWTASSTRGYGCFSSVARKTVRVHRLAWELAVGPIPANMLVLHAPNVCHNTRCVNPAHLRLGTRADNMADRKKDGTEFVPFTQGEKHGNAKLTEAKVAEIRSLYAGGDVTQGQISKAYGVSKALISFIVNGKSWAHSHTRLAA